jgi:hypothetical protein
MDDNRPDDSATAPDAGRPRRAPPTIDLEASEVTTSSESAGSGGDGAKGEARQAPWLSYATLQPFLIAALTGAVTAAAVIVGARMAGWPAETARPIAEINTGAIEALS